VTKTARTVALLFLLALAARLGTGLWTGLDRQPVEDERGYVDTARSVATDHGFALDRFFDVNTHALVNYEDAHGPSFPLPDMRELRSFRGPVVPLLFSAFASNPAKNWREPSRDLAPMRLIALLLGALGPALLFLALRNSPLGDRAWWPAAAYALWPPAIYVSQRAISEAPSQALLLGAMATLCIPRPRNGAFAGAFAALSVLARPSALIPAGLLMFATGTKKRAALFLAAFIVVMSPWVIRNWTIHGRPLMTTNSGVTLVGGNIQAALDQEHPGKWVPPERVYAARSDIPDRGMWGWSNLSEEASDRRFTSDALTWIRENPASAARLEFWKLVRLFDPDQHSEKPDAASKAWIGWLTFAPVLLLAILGLGAWRVELPWTMLLLGTIATALIFYGDVRMRTCADPALLVFAAHGASRFVKRRVSP